MHLPELVRSSRKNTEFLRELIAGFNGWYRLRSSLRPPAAGLLLYLNQMPCVLQDITPLTPTVATAKKKFLWGTHAYLLQRNIAARLLDRTEFIPWDAKPLDLWLVNQNLTTYIINPPLVQQKAFGYSDVKNRSHEHPELQRL